MNVDSRRPRPGVGRRRGPMWMQCGEADAGDRNTPVGQERRNGASTTGVEPFAREEKAASLQSWGLLIPARRSKPTARRVFGHACHREIICQTRAPAARSGPAGSAAAFRF